MSAINKLTLFGLALLVCGQVDAGGPLAIEGSSGHTPVRYSPATVSLNFDVGNLGARTNSDADVLVLQAFALWNNVTTSTLLLTQGDDLAVDIDDTNFMPLIPDGSQNHPSSTDRLNPVVYDDDGKIIDSIFGVGASDAIAGFAASVYYVRDDKFKEGYAVLNGKLTLTNSDVVGLVTHEIGHFIGLDHSQLDIDNSETDSTSLVLPKVCTTRTQDKYPVMYPYLCRIEKTLHVDDRAALSALYPSSDIATLFGQINGVFVNTSNTPILGANLWVTNTVTGASYSIVSDYLLQGTGFFAIYLPAGTYTLHANSINPLFNAESSVGPYAYDQSDISFQSPHPIAAVDFAGSTPGTAEVITITVGAGTRLRFVADGSGEASEGAIITPPPSVASSSKSGALSLASLLLLTGALYLRRRV